MTFLDAETPAECEADVMTLDGVVSDPLTAAALIAVQMCRARRACSWFAPAFSPGANLIGRRIACTGFAVGWYGAKEDAARGKELFWSATGLAEDVDLAKQMMWQYHKSVTTSTNVRAAIAHSRSIASDLSIEGFFAGWSTNRCIDVLNQWTSNPRKLVDLRQALLDPDTQLFETERHNERNANIGPTAFLLPGEAGSSVVTIHLDPMTHGEFALLSRLIAGLSSSLRERLFSRGGIYGFDIEVATSGQSIAFWSDSDSDPLATTAAVLQAVQHATSANVARASTSVRYVPSLPPPWDIESRRAIQELLGFRDSDLLKIRVEADEASLADVARRLRENSRVVVATTGSTPYQFSESIGQHA